jgi:hypothetical protein
MELDILKCTGCRWSKIIYPGYKGVRLPQQDSSIFLSAEKLMRDAVIRHSSQQNLSQSPVHSNFMSNIKEFHHIVDGMGLKNNDNVNPMSNINAIMQKHAFSAQTPGKDKSNTPMKATTPFNNEYVRQFTLKDDQNENSTIQSLQKRIKEAKMSEPRSLFGDQGYSLNRGGGSSSKKRKIMGLPDHNLKKFDLKDLETVPEKVGSTYNNSITIDHNIKKMQQPQITRSVTKKVVNGEIIRASQSLRSNGAPNDPKYLKLRNKSIGSNNEQVDSKSTFTNAA